MAKLTRGERFKDGRTVYNYHGKQTMDEVSEATGVSKSLIQSLESDKSNRSVGYDKIVALAQHYHVSIDWLLGLSEEYTTDQTIQSVCHYTGLSSYAVKVLHTHRKPGKNFVTRLVDDIIKINALEEEVPSLIYKAAIALFLERNLPPAHAEGTICEIENKLAYYSGKAGTKFVIPPIDAAKFYLMQAEILVTAEIENIVKEMCIDVADTIPDPDPSEMQFFHWIRLDEEFQEVYDGQY